MSKGHKITPMTNKHKREVYTTIKFKRGFFACEITKILKIFIAQCFQDYRKTSPY